MTTSQLEQQALLMLLARLKDAELERVFQGLDEQEILENQDRVARRLGYLIERELECRAEWDKQVGEFMEELENETD